MGLWTIGVLLWTTVDYWGDSWGLLGVPGWPLRGYCGFLGTTGCYLGLLWTIGYYCGLLGATGSYLGLLWTIGVLLWTTVDYCGDSWGHLGLLGTPGCSWLAPKRVLWIPGDYWVLLGTTVDYWVLLWITVDYWGDSWGHLGLLGTPGGFWLATKRLLWIPGGYWVLLGTTVDCWGTSVDYCGLLG